MLREGGLVDNRKEGAHALGNFLTYAQTCWDSWDERPFSSVDSLVLSWLAYYRLPADWRAVATWEGVDVRDLLRLECRESMTGGLWDPEGSWNLLVAVCANPRYRGLRVCGYRTEFDAAAEEQFAAVTFCLPDGNIYVAYRGTDSTMVGWKEDFNMSFRCPVPAQTTATSYLESVTAALDGPLMCGGHSKGGNLAVYAASMCDPAVRERLVRVYSHDGPGFNETFLGGAEYQALSATGKIDKTLPRSSIIGMIFEHQEDYAVVESCDFGLLQHNPFSWVVPHGEADFAYCEGLSAGARYMDDALAAWVAGVTPAERGRFIDELFELLSVTGAERFSDITADWQQNVPKILSALAEVDSDTRRFLIDTLAAFARCALTPKLPELSSLIETLRASLSLERFDGIPALRDKVAAALSERDFGSNKAL